MILDLFKLTDLARTQADIDAVVDEVRRRGRRALAVRTDVVKTDDLRLSQRSYGSGS